MSRFFDPFDDEPVRACGVCGCTEDHACVVDGVACHWVEEHLCSNPACVATARARPITADDIRSTDWTLVFHAKLAKGGSLYEHRGYTYRELRIARRFARGQDPVRQIFVNDVEAPWGDWAKVAEMLNAARAAEAAT